MKATATQIKRTGNAGTPPEPGKQLWSLPNVAHVLSISRSMAWRLDSARRLPGRVLLGRSVRFRAEVITRWISAGCPPLEEFVEEVTASAQPPRNLRLADAK